MRVVVAHRVIRYIANIIVNALITLILQVFTVCGHML